MSISEGLEELGDNETIVDFQSGKKNVKNCCGLLDFYDPEGRGYVLVGAARGFAVLTGVLYLTLAANSIATEVGGCKGEIDLGIFGSVQATSVVAFATTTEGIITAIVSPFFGAFTDLSPHRKRIYIFVQTTWALMSAVHFAMLFSSNFTVGFLIAFVLALVTQSLFYELSYVVHFSFLPEIGQGNHDMVSALSSKYYMLLNLFQVLGVVLIVAITTVMNSVIGEDEDGEVFFNTYRTAQLASFMVVAACTFFSYRSFRLIKNRPASKALEEDGETKRNIFSGLKRVLITLKLVFTQYFQVFKFLIGFMFLMGTVAAVVTLATVYFQSYLGLSPTVIQFVVLIALAFSVPGAAIGNVLKNRLPVKKVMLLITGIWIIAVTAAPLVLQGRELTEEEILELNNNVTSSDECDSASVMRTHETWELMLCFVFGIVWGLGIGGSYPVAASFYSMIIPGGQEAEFFGLRTFLLKVATPLPPLVFTAINEATKGRLDYAFLGTVPFFVVAFLFILWVDYDQAQVDIEHTLHLRRAGEESERRIVSGKIVDKEDA